MQNGFTPYTCCLHVFRFCRSFSLFLLIFIIWGYFSGKGVSEVVLQHSHSSLRRQLTHSHVDIQSKHVYHSCLMLVLLTNEHGLNQKLFPFFKTFFFYYSLVGLQAHYMNLHYNAPATHGPVLQLSVFVTKYNPDLSVASVKPSHRLFMCRVPAVTSLRQHLSWSLRWTNLAAALVHV